MTRGGTTVIVSARTRSPVQSARKLSTVFGTVFPHRAMTTRPSGCPSVQDCMLCRPVRNCLHTSLNVKPSAVGDGGVGALVV